MASLTLCTILYIAVAAILTGMVPFQEIDIDAPLAKAFGQVGLPWAHALISIGALTGITSVLLVLMLSQPRIMLAMARDGLLPRNFFGAVHERWRTPWKSTLLTGSLVAVMGSLLPLRILAELVNIGTLLAFAMVSLGVLILRKQQPNRPRPFRTPIAWFVCPLAVVGCLLLFVNLSMTAKLVFAVWAIVGLILYSTYGYKRSQLANGN